MAETAAFTNTISDRHPAPDAALNPRADWLDAEALVDDVLAMAEWLRDHGLPSERG